MLDRGTYVKPAEGVVYRRLAEGEGGVVLRLDTGAYHGLNETGSLIWELMEGGSTVGELAAELGRRVDEAPGKVDADVAAFVDDLSRRGLVLVEAYRDP